MMAKTGRLLTRCGMVLAACFLFNGGLVQAGTLSHAGTGVFVDTGQVLGSDSRAVAAGDVDGDGDVDLFVANNGANRVWLNDGSGLFAVNGQALGSALSQGVALGDVDGDSDLDAAVANNGYDEVWLNDGMGQFTDSGQQIGSSTGNSRAVVLGDFDGDGDLDVVEVGALGGQVWVNNGNGVFSTGQSIASGNSYGIAVLDAEPDGDLDFAVAANGSNTLWRNNGAGTFVNAGLALGTGDYRAVAAAPLNAGSSVDLLFVGDGVTEIRLNDGSGTSFGLSAGVLTVGAASGLAVGDLDGDGDVDVVVSSTSGDNQRWLNDGGAAFTAAALPVATSNAVVIAQLTGDSVLDVFFANAGTNRLLVNDGSGGLDMSAQAINGPINSRAAAFGDIDGDGVVDAVVVGTNSGVVWGAVGGVMQGAPLQVFDSGLAQGAALGDLDGDTDLDVFVAANGPNYVWRNEGGVLVDYWNDTFSTDSRGVALGDFDGDGDLDAFVVNNGTGRVWINDGTGQFDFDTDDVLGSGTPNSRAVALGDLDGDGDLDAVVINGSVANRVWTLAPDAGDPEGFGFTASAAAIGSSGRAVALGDVDGDGDLDIWVANDADDQVYLNNGSGGFSAGTTIANGASRGVALVDVDGDGDLDAVVQGLDGVVTVSFNNGSGAFSGATAYGVAATNVGVGVVAGDVDADGDPDVLALRFGVEDGLWRNVSGASVDISSDSGDNESAVGDNVVFTATVSGAGALGPTGTIDFFENSVAVAACTDVVLVGGVATCERAFGTTGVKTMSAQYGGDDRFAGATSSDLVHTVKLAASVSVSANPVDESEFGTAVTFTATISGGAGSPTGSVAFSTAGGAISGCASVAVSAGQAQCVTSGLALGAQTVTAAYGGDATYGAASGQVGHTVKGTPTVVLTIDPNDGDSLVGETVTLTATVAGGGDTPTGTVAFRQGGVEISGCAAVALSSGEAECPVNGLAAGAYEFSASYGGDGAYVAGASGTLDHDVDKRTPTVVINRSAGSNPAQSGTAVTFAAQVSGSGGTPSGTVDFLVDGVVVGTCDDVSLVGGVAQCVMTLLTGEYVLTASYGGDAVYLSDTSSGLDQAMLAWMVYLPLVRR